MNERFDVVLRYKVRAHMSHHLLEVGLTNITQGENVINYIISCNFLFLDD